MIPTREGIDGNRSLDSHPMPNLALVLDHPLRNYLVPIIPHEPLVAVRTGPEHDYVILELVTARDEFSGVYDAWELLTETCDPPPEWNKIPIIDLLETIPPSRLPKSPQESSWGPEGS